MSMTMDELRAALKADPDKAKAFEQALAGMTPETAGSEAEAVSLAAKAAGFEITPEEVERACAAKLELDESELEAAGGGTSEHDDFCLGVVWHCYATFLHTDDTGKGTRCWDDWVCWMNYYNYCSGTTFRSDSTCTIAWHYTPKD